MRSEIGIDIDAEPELVFALARDVECWSVLLPHYARSRAIDRTTPGRPIVRFVARRPLVPVLGIGLPVVWAARTWSEPEARRLHFEHVAGATRGMRVVWRIEPGATGGADVTISHDFAPAIPGFAWFVDRCFTRPIAGRTLATFKALAEAVGGVGTSDRSPTTKASP